MKDRARPFSRKHRRYWLTVTGGMMLIMSINLGLGFGVMQCDRPDDPPADYRPIPPPELPPGRQDAAVAPLDGDGVDARPLDPTDADVDAGVDASPTPPAPT